MILTNFLATLILFTAGSHSDPFNRGEMTANEVIKAIQANVTCNWSKETVDTFKSGDPEDVVTGIACTFTATVEVLKEAAERGCNLIITHEPSYYNHLDSDEMFKDDPVFKPRRP